MPKAPTTWLASWTGREVAAVVVPALASLAPLVIVGRSAGWLSGLLALTAFIVLNVIVFRHGGWGLLGPHFYYDVVRLARRGRSTILRIVYILAMFGGFLYVFDDSPVSRPWTPNDFARVSNRFAYTLFFVQNLAIVVLIPAYLASAIAEERERRTLELLFTTQLSDTEIVLGKLTSRLIHLVGFVLAGFPIVSLIQLWGGIDLLLIAGNLLNTLLNILSIGSFCLSISTFCKTTSTAVLASYAIVLPISLCCVGAGDGFPFVLQDSRQGGASVPTVQDLGQLAVAHLVMTVIWLFTAVVALRNKDGIEPPHELILRRPPPLTVANASSSSPLPTVEAMATEPELREKVGLPPMTSERSSLPPVTDNPLLWKERYLGGSSWILSPLIVVPLVPFLVLGFLIFLCGMMQSLHDGAHRHEAVVRLCQGLLHFFYYVFLISYALGVGYRAAVTVARERQQQTLEPLLLLPIERSEILFAKLVGVLWKGWPWLALIAADIILGTLIGAFHPFSAVLLCLAPWPMILFLATFGMLLSVVMHTVLRATMVMVIVQVTLLSCSCLQPMSVSARPWVNTFAFSLRNDFDTDAVDAVIPWVMLVLLSAAAFACWKIALVLFENRART